MSSDTRAVRRSQAERRATTQGALIRATIECLIELGYAGTTTHEVQRRAGVSRGALTHHFASKAELLIAAMDQLYDDFSSGIIESASALPPGQARVRPVIQLIWSRFTGPLFMAAMELWTAARTDGELRAALLPHEQHLGHQLRDLAAEVFGETVSAHPAADAAYHVLMTSMRGQAMTYFLRPDADRDGPHLQYWFGLVEAFAASVPPHSETD